MKFAIVLCLLGVALARPEQDAQIIRSESTGPVQADFTYDFETSNGISANKVGSAGSAGQSNMQGGFSFTLPDGTLATFTYVADENGNRVESPLLPVAPPAPPHVAELLRIAEEQRAQGITFE